MQSIQRAVLILLFVAASGSSARASDSLYDRKTAQKLDPKQFSLFGPQAANFRYDSRMLRAAQIAEGRAHAHSTARCWRYVKDALLAAKILTTRPKTAYAKQAGDELEKDFGFKKLNIRDPYQAPIGSVLVYGGRGAGHVELRTAQGFVSDFVTPRASPRPLIGVFIKPPA